jgi:multidrug efflux pump subunit AcrA (membrane-fusion protein)
MRSIQRIGLIAATLVTGAAIGGAFVAEGFITTQKSAVTSPPTVSEAPDASGVLDPETVYVRPAATPQIIHVTRTAPPATQPPVIHMIVPSTGERHGHEGNDD